MSDMDSRARILLLDQKVSAMDERIDDHETRLRRVEPEIVRGRAYAALLAGVTASVFSALLSWLLHQT